MPKRYFPNAALLLHPGENSLTHKKSQTETSLTPNWRTKKLIMGGGKCWLLLRQKCFEANASFFIAKHSQLFSWHKMPVLLLPLYAIIVMQNFHNISAKIDDLSELYKRVLYPSFQTSLISSILLDPKPKEMISQPHPSSKHCAQSGWTQVF